MDGTAIDRWYCRHGGIRYSSLVGCVGGAFEDPVFNNWLNHGFLLPLGMEQVHAAGGSILFLLEEIQDRVSGFWQPVH